MDIFEKILSENEILSNNFKQYNELESINSMTDEQYNEYENALFDWENIVKKFEQCCYYMEFLKNEDFLEDGGFFITFLENLIELFGYLNENNLFTSELYDNITFDILKQYKDNFNEKDKNKIIEYIRSDYFDATSIQKDAYIDTIEICYWSVAHLQYILHHINFSVEDLLAMIEDGPILKNTFSKIVNL